jgi:hypothetical protein
MCADTFSAQIGNQLIDTVMETKLLDFNLDKSCYMVIGEECAQNDIRKQFQETPLTLSGVVMKEVNEEKYLGDYISAGGLDKSTIVTIDRRYNKVVNALVEIRAVVEDCRSHITGGIKTGLEIWEMAYLLNT